MTTQADSYFDDEDVMILDNGNEWVTCWQCGGEGTTGHDCGEDSCCCADPEDNVVCDECGGKGGWEREPDWKKWKCLCGGLNASSLRECGNCKRPAPTGPGDPNEL